MSLLQEEVSRFLEAWMRVRQVVQAANFNQFRRAGLSATQFMTLNVIPEDGLTLSEIARILNLSAASLKKTVDSLAEKGLVVRKPRASDEGSSTPSLEYLSAMSDGERPGLVAGLEQQ